MLPDARSLNCTFVVGVTVFTSLFCANRTVSNWKRMRMASWKRPSGPALVKDADQACGEFRTIVIEELGELGR